METKTGEVFRRNSSSNFSHATNSTSREYVFAPVSYRVKITLLTVMLVFGVYGFVANSLILYFKHKQHKRKRRSRIGPVTRPLTEYFVISLALSDLLSALISLPLFAAEIIIDFVKTDSICRLNKFFSVLFPTVTILSLLVIGVERYIAILHPFSVLGRRRGKRMVVGAWILGSLIALGFTPAFKLVYSENTSDNSFTIVCKYDRSLQLNRGLLIGFYFISYLIPSFVLTFTNIRILMRQRSSQRAAVASQTTQRALSRMKVTRMFVSLIFAFIIPFMIFFLYSGLRTAMEFHVSFTVDYIVRCTGGLLLYANGLVSATILIYYEQLYLDFLSCFRSRSATNNQEVQGVKRVAPSNNGGNNKNVQCTAV